MSELLIENLKKSIGKEAEIFLTNRFRFFGKIIACDDEIVNILDYRSGHSKFIRISTISDAEIVEEEAHD